MDFNAMRERLAQLAREIKEMNLESYGEGQVPVEVGVRLKAKMEEADMIREKLADAQKLEGLRADADQLYDEFWSPADEPRTRQIVDLQPDEWKSVGEVVQQVRVFQVSGRLDPRLQKQLVEGTGALGGFLVPTAFEETLLTIMAEGAIVEPRATILPMTVRQLDIPAIDYAVISSPDGQTNFFGGAVFEWTEEAATKPEIDIRFRMKQLVVHDLTGYLPVSDSLLQDAVIALPPIFNRTFGEGSRWYADYAYLQGDGVGKPTGVINAGATIVVPRAGAGAVTYPDFVQMKSQLLMTGVNPVWVISQSVMPSLYLMQDAAGNYIWPLFGGNAAGGGGERILGYPIIWTEKLNALGVAGDVMLADFSYYLIGRRSGVTISVSEHYLFRSNQTAFKVVSRLDGNPWLNEPIETQDGTTVSPFLILGDSS
jgi:HK97 family phage major capsid protein